MLTKDKVEKIKKYYLTRDRWRQILEYRKLQPLRYPVKNLFYGDSITEVWPLHEFFPSHNILNRGIGGDTVDGLFFRLKDDVLAYHPERVFIMAGINGIEDENVCSQLKELAILVRKQKIEVFCCSILPLRSPDKWNRFQYQNKIILINNELEAWVKAGNAEGFINYHSKVKDKNGELARKYAQADGTHLNFSGYCKLSQVIEPYLIK